MWIYIPDTDESKDPWVGTLTRPDQPKAWWGFKLVRHVEPPDWYRVDPFAGGNTVVGLLDHQLRCTLLRPRYSNVEPGSVGVKYDIQRTQITGEFDALLTGLPVTDANVPRFTSLSFDSETFSVWYGPPAFSTKSNYKTHTTSVQIPDTKTTQYEVSGVGRVLVTTGAQVSSHGHGGTIHSAAIFRLEFTALISLYELTDSCMAIERLFGFLIGFRGKLPVFRTWVCETYKAGEHDVPYDGTLEISGADWMPGEVPHPMRCIHRLGQGGGTLEVVLGNFFKTQTDFLLRFHAVEFSRHFSNNLNDCFSVIVPPLEEYLKRRYTSADEVHYMEHQQAFFDWVEKSEDKNITEFCRKHIDVRPKGKAASFETLLTRGLQFLNSKGFQFPLELAKQKKDRRGKLFHAAPKITEAEVVQFHREVKVATALLMLHTFDDLGIDIMTLSQDISALPDFREFLTLPPRPEVPKDVTTVAQAVASLPPSLPGETNSEAVHNFKIDAVVIRRGKRTPVAG